jgi:hypothetical protein
VDTCGVELHIIPSVVGLQSTSRRRKTFRWLKWLRWLLVELPKIPSIVGLQGPLRRWKTFQWLKGLRCVLVELPNIPSVVGCKNLQEAEGISMVEEDRCKLMEQHGVVGSKGKSSKVIDG